MDRDAIIAVVVLAIVVACFATGRLRLDVVALGGVLILFLAEVLTMKEALAGFSDPVVLMIAATFVIGQAIVKVGLADMVANLISRYALGQPRRLIAGLMIFTAVLSAFLSSTGTVAIMMPVAVNAAQQVDIAPSKVLLPTAISALMGGLLTLIATPPNLIVSDLLRANGDEPLNFFALTPFGVIGVLVATVFISTIGHRLLPSREAPPLVDVLAPDAGDAPIEAKSAELLGTDSTLSPNGSQLRRSSTGVTGARREPLRGWRKAVRAVVHAPQRWYAWWLHLLYQPRPTREENAGGAGDRANRQSAVPLVSLFTAQDTVAQVPVAHSQSASVPTDGAVAGAGDALATVHSPDSDRPEAAEPIRRPASQPAAEASRSRADAAAVVVPSDNDVVRQWSLHKSPGTLEAGVASVAPSEEPTDPDMPDVTRTTTPGSPPATVKPVSELDATSAVADVGYPLVKARVQRASSFIGKAVAELKIRQRYGVSLVAIERSGRDAASVPSHKRGASVDSGGHPASPANASIKEASKAHASGFSAKPDTRHHSRPSWLPSNTSSITQPTTTKAATDASDHADDEHAETTTTAAIAGAFKRNRRKAPHHRVRAVYVDTQIRAGDLLFLYGQPASIRALLDNKSAALAVEGETAWIPAPVVLAEFVVPANSIMIGLTIKQTQIESAHALTVLSLAHRDRRIVGHEIADVRLEAGDVVLVSGHQRSLLGWLKTTLVPPLTWVFVTSYPSGSLGRPAPVFRRLIDRWRLWTCILVLLAMLIVMTGAWLPNAMAVIGAAYLLVILRCVTAEEAYAAISWESVILTASMLPIVNALQKTGIIDAAADGIAQVGFTGGPYATIVVLFLTTSLISQLMSNTACALLFAPVAYSVAVATGVSPRPMMVTVAVAASSAFMTPVASPVVTMVYGPGRYKFTDYLGVGFSLYFFMLLLTLALAPAMFPF